jgi:hypothetical protein
MNGHLDAKRQHEQETFNAFCEAAQLSVEAGSFRQPDPPAPDITVNLVDIGPVAFELVRLNDPDQLTRLNLMHQTPAFLDTALMNLDPEMQENFRSAYIDSVITVGFRGAVHLGDRRRALPFFWDTLLALPAGFSGQVDLWGKGAPEAIESIWVSRAITGGRPWFKTYTTGYVLPLVAERIAEKLSKRYICSEPLELLAYVHWGELAHLGAADEISMVVNQRIEGSQWRRGRDANGRPAMSNCRVPLWQWRGLSNFADTEFLYRWSARARSLHSRRLSAIRRLKFCPIRVLSPL